MQARKVSALIITLFIANAFVFGQANHLEALDPNQLGNPQIENQITELQKTQAGYQPNTPIYIKAQDEINALRDKDNLNKLVKIDEALAAEQENSTSYQQDQQLKAQYVAKYNSDQAANVKFHNQNSAVLGRFNGTAQDAINQDKTVQKLQNDYNNQLDKIIKASPEYPSLLKKYGGDLSKVRSEMEQNILNHNSSSKPMLELKQTLSKLNAATKANATIYNTTRPPAPTITATPLSQDILLAPDKLQQMGNFYYRVDPNRIYKKFQADYQQTFGKPFVPTGGAAAPIPIQSHAALPTTEKPMTTKAVTPTTTPPKVESPALKSATKEKEPSMREAMWHAKPSTTPPQESTKQEHSKNVHLENKKKPSKDTKPEKTTQTTKDANLEKVIHPSKDAKIENKSQKQITKDTKLEKPAQPTKDTKLDKPPQPTKKEKVVNPSGNETLLV